MSAKTKRTESSTGLRVALLCHSLAGTGGTERAVATLSDVLADEHKVWALSFDPPGTQRSFDSRSTFVPLGRSLGLPLGLRVISYAFDAYRLRRVKRELGIQVTISSLWRADLISVLSCGKDTKIAVCQINLVGNETNRLLVRFRRLVSLVYRQFDRVVACTGSVGTEVRELFGIEESRCRVIHNIVPPASVSVGLRAHERIRVLFCGRLVAEKNPLAAVEIYARTRKVNSNIQFVLIGDGPLRPEVKALIVAKGLSIGDDFEDAMSDVILTGFVADSAMYVSQCDIQLVPSVSEGIPLALIDGFSAGVPALVSDFGGGGARDALGVGGDIQLGKFDVIEAEGGLLLGVPDPSDQEMIALWSDLLFKVAGDPELRSRLGVRARAQARTFHPEVVGPEWRHLLRENR